MNLLTSMGESNSFLFLKKNKPKNLENGSQKGTINPYNSENIAKKSKLITNCYICCKKA